MIENTSGYSIFDDIEIFAKEFYSFLAELLETVVKKSTLPSFNFDLTIFDSLKFDLDLWATDLQKTLLKVIFLLLLTSIVLSGICWRKYGEEITDKFIKPSKLSTLKFVRHSFRFVFGRYAKRN